MKRSVVFLTVMALLFAAAQTDAGEIEPRAYVNTPVGINFLLAGYTYSKGDLSTPGASPLKDAQVTMDTGILAYARSLDVWGNSGKIDIIVPYTDLSGNALVAGEPRERQISGFNDPRARFSVNFYGSPALSLEEFASYKQDLLIGASVQVSAPFGQYDKSKLINIGNHRWYVKPDIGISRQWGDATLELSTGVTFYTDNDAYYVGRNQQQAPVYTSQFHFTYSFGRGLWGAVSGTLDQGGRTTVDGVRNDDRQNNSRLGVTLAMPVNRNNSLKLYASRAISTTVGNDYNLYGIVWQYRWGGGL